MKKALLLLNGLQDPMPIVSSAIGVLNTDNSYVHIVFLQRIYALVNLEYPLGSDLYLTEKLMEEDAKTLDQNMAITRQALDASGISYTVAENDDPTLAEILDHSAFSDIILLDARMDLSDLITFPLNVSVKDLLSDAHCPVMLLGDQINPLEKIILVYDGSYSGIYSIKLFSYLFPRWCSLPAQLVRVHTSESKHIEFEEYSRDWLPRHFPYLETTDLKGKASEELPAFINQEKNNRIVVMGAYGKTAVTRLFRQSLTTAVLEKTTASLFITHE